MLSPESSNSPIKTNYPKGITPNTENRIREELFVGHLWWRHQRPIAQTVMSVMEKEVIEIDSYVSRLPSGEIDPFFFGYVSLMSNIQSALIFQDPRYRLSHVKGTLELSSILKERFGDSSLSGLRDESFTKQQRDLELLEEDPLGLTLAKEKAEEMKKSYGEGSERYAGVEAALQRYEELLEKTQELSSSPR